MKREHVTVLCGRLTGKTSDIEGILSIGRNPENSLHLEDLQISRWDAIIEQRPTGTFIRDLGSGNGTFVGNRRVLECRLSDGDVIRLGSVELRYQAAGTDVFVALGEEDAATVEASDAASVYQTFFQSPQQEASAEQMRDAQKRLAAVYRANEIITSERDLRKLFASVMDQIFSLVPAHNGAILLPDEKTGELIAEYSRSGSGSASISSTIVRRAFDNGEAVLTRNDDDDERFEAGASIIAQNIASAMCAPLSFQNERLGVLYVDTRGTTNAFVKSDLELLVALAAPAAISIKNAQYLHKLERSYRDTLRGIANAVEGRDHYTGGHTHRVTNFALEIARKLGWAEEQLEMCRMGGVLHDVGKIAVDDAVLRKPGRLTDEEFAKMRIHPERGARMLQDIESLRPLIPYCLYHHERYDGKGYPKGLAGEAIPIEGRLIAVADAFDSMTSNRPYRKALDPELAIAEVERCKGTQFDPAVADALVACYREGKITPIVQESLKGGRSISCPFCSTFISIPEGANLGHVFECQVCHRNVQLQEQNNALFGELAPQTR